MYGTYETIDGKPAVRFERVYPHPVERVWRSVTVPEEMAVWFPSTVEVDLREGGAMRFTFDPHLAEPMDGEVVELDPPKVFAFLWGKDLLRLELAPEGEGTRLTLLQTLDEDEAARNAAGWHVCLDKLAGKNDTDWEPLYEEYQRRGVPAGAEIPGGS
jgi:uncharacterized protein YndB with AHSA1/START domain